MKRVAAIAFLLLALLANGRAFGFVDPPTFNPAAPNSAQPVTVSVRNGVCDYFAVGVGAPPTRVEYSPGIVDVIAPGVITFDPFCIADVATDTFAIRALAAGNYQVRIWITDGTFAYQQTTMVSSAPLTVTLRPAAQPIPMLGTGSLFMMVLFVLLVALHFPGGRRQMMTDPQ